MNVTRLNIRGPYGYGFPDISVLNKCQQITHLWLELGVITGLPDGTIQLDDNMFQLFKQLRKSFKMFSKYAKDSMDRFGDDLCEVLLSYLSFEDRFRNKKRYTNDPDYDLSYKQYGQLMTSLFCSHQAQFKPGLVVNFWGGMGCEAIWLIFA
ncbi:unnamed protein product [Medioppia subpectinata]|uniref:Uncharacterized protein n=1 Tax=Medioppia subpectinata TaxID=1979941 RepID=A0A7R9PVG5_9ACAR|nr:unnamed protein product [Medioppia subpectinata]CAG2102809.1 unnamed protein product [Medioppia subpectinata]